MNEITCKDLEQIIENKRTAFLCGNGFSINFDEDFSNIYDRLFEAHKAVLRNIKYDVKGKRGFSKVFKDNYNSVRKYMYAFTSKNLEEIFTSGIIFAESIVYNKELLQMIKNTDSIHELVFGVSEIDIVQNIAETGKEKGYKSVNIEYWSMLIYMYYIIKKENIDADYEFPKNNLFITLVKLGNVNKGNLVTGTNDIHQYIMSNGFNTYYRMLFSTAIWNHGKAVDLSQMQNLETLDLKKIKIFLEQYKALMTLNYDHIIENIVDVPVLHIHGEFIKGKLEYVYFQSIGLEDVNEEYVSFSDILIGDYFVNKTFSNMISSMNKDPLNKKVINVSRAVGNEIRCKDIESIVILGMNINNDQHIIRDIMLALGDESEKNTKIIYCYFNENDRDDFRKQYEASITFSDEMKKKVREVEVNFIRTDDILKTYFLK